jgi:N-acetylglucosamine-6-phosphate deacetylase
MGVGIERAILMASAYPAAAMSSVERGKLLAGYRADFVHLKNLITAGTWVGGKNVVQEGR